MDLNDVSAVILSLSGTILSDAERDLFSSCNPLGFILFARNCETPEQLKKLTDDLRDCVGRDCPILIDQEGGRVQRMKAPVWRDYPSAAHFGALASQNLEEGLETLRFVTLQMAEELRDCGINTNCAPLVDVHMHETHEVIGDRAYSHNPNLVSRLGLSVCRHYLAAGVTPIIKHIPGHGRATADSHKELPTVSAPIQAMLHTDFLPFKEIAHSDCADAVWAMTAHVIYSGIDPKHPASTSRTVINDVIRKYIGFDGVLVSDDLDMEALNGYGDVPERALAVLDAGCDVALYCAGKLEIMEKIAESVPKLSEDTLKRLQKAAEFTKIAA